MIQEGKRMTSLVEAIINAANDNSYDRVTDLPKIRTLNKKLSIKPPVFDTESREASAMQIARSAVIIAALWQALRQETGLWERAQIRRAINAEERIRSKQTIHDLILRREGVAL